MKLDGYLEPRHIFLIYCPNSCHPICSRNRTLEKTFTYLLVAPQRTVRTLHDNYTLIIKDIINPSLAEKLDHLDISILFRNCHCACGYNFQQTFIHLYHPTIASVVKCRLYNFSIHIFLATLSYSKVSHYVLDRHKSFHEEP